MIFDRLVPTADILENDGALAIDDRDGRDELLVDFRPDDVIDVFHDRMVWMMRRDPAPDFRIRSVDRQVQNLDRRVICIEGRHFVDVDGVGVAFTAEVFKCFHDINRTRVVSGAIDVIARIWRVHPGQLKLADGERRCCGRERQKRWHQKKFLHRESPQRITSFKPNSCRER